MPAKNGLPARGMLIRFFWGNRATSAWLAASYGRAQTASARCRV